MTPQEFKDKHGAAFKAFARTACFTALLQTLADAHPMKRLKKKKEGDKVHGAVMFLAQIDGYEECLDIIHTLNLDTPLSLEEPPSDYAEEIPT